MTPFEIETLLRIRREESPYANVTPKRRGAVTRAISRLRLAGFLFREAAIRITPSGRAAAMRAEAEERAEAWANGR